MRLNEAVGCLDDFKLAAPASMVHRASTKVHVKVLLTLQWMESRVQSQAYSMQSIDCLEILYTKVLICVGSADD